MVRRVGWPLLGLVLLAGLGLVLFQQSQLARQAPAPPLLGQGGSPAQPPGQSGGPAYPTRVPGASELRVLLPSVATLDPGVAYDSESIPVVQLLFEGLLTVDDQGQLVGRGAQRWQVSPDGLTYTFYLNPEARWSDGRRVSAEDYVFAWQRNVDPRTGSPYAPALFVIKNGAAIGRGELPPEQLGVRARDAQTLIVTLESPAPYFPWLVATWTYYPLRRDQIQQLGPAWSEPDNLVGNGPYVVQGIRGPDVVLARNEQYGGPRPAVERIVFRAYPTIGEALEAFRQRELDIMPYAAALEPVVSQDPQLRRAIKVFPRSSTAFVVLNHRRPALQDERVRRALGLALDRAALVRDILGGAGEAATSLHPEGIGGRDPSLWPKEDLAEARRLLSQAGYPEGRGLELSLAVAGVADRLGQQLQQRWQDALGITVRLVEVSEPGPIGQSAQWQDELDLYVGSWQSDYEDPANWFNLLWDSHNDPGQYSSGWRSAEFDQLVHAGQVEGDAARRVELYRQAEAIMAREYPLIPLYYPSEQYLVRPEVQGFHPGRTALTVPLLGVSLGGATPL